MILGGILTPLENVMTDVLTWLHSGSVRYYAGRVTMRYDLLDRDWLDRAVEWLNARGVAVYALLDRASIDAEEIIRQGDLSPVLRRPCLASVRDEQGRRRFARP